MKSIVFFLAFSVISIQPAYSFSSKPPVVVDQKPTPAQPTPPPVIVEPTKPNEGKPANLNTITDFAAGSSCAKFKFGWGSAGKKGTMPAAYFRGEALTYARTVCNPSRADVVVVGQALGDAKKDGLVYLADKFKAIGAGLSTKEERIRAVHLLLIGSAMRESSGRWCVGKDAGANNISGETCEAGLHQTSWNSRKSHAVLPDMFNLYAKKKDGCYFDVYSKGVSCSAENLANYGSGDGVTFQEMSKKCPGFAVEWAAVTARVLRSHYGPYNRKTVEVVKECDSMLLGIEKLVKENPSLCEALK